MYVHIFDSNNFPLKVNAYIVKEKLPKELEVHIYRAANPDLKSYGNQVRRAAVSSLQRVLSQPAMGQVPTFYFR